MYQPSVTTNSNLSSMETSVTLTGKPNSPGKTENKIDTSSQRRRLPFGAIVSPLSPFFNERAKHFAVQQVRASYMEEALKKLDHSTENHPNRFRSRSQSSESKDSEGGSSAYSSGDSSSASIESSDSNHSFATATTMMEAEQLPQNIPRISYEEWSKFGISLFTPKLSNPHTRMYYHYPSVENNKNNLSSLLHGNRPRSKSSVTPSTPAQRIRDQADVVPQSGSHLLGATLNSPLAHAQSPRCNSLRLPMERNHTSH